MERIPEPELMDDPAQAAAYAGADFTEPHNQFISKFREVFSGQSITGKVLELGCGPADISIRFARAFPQCRIDGVDGAGAMLVEGRRLSRAAGLENRIHLLLGIIPGFSPPEPGYSTLISNSLLHHLHDPMVIWSYIKLYSQPDSRIFVMDLMRPENEPKARKLVNTYCEGEPEILRRDFYNSLCAAFTPDEVKRQLIGTGMQHLTLEVISDRHMMIHSK